MQPKKFTTYQKLPADPSCKKIKAVGMNRFAAASAGFKISAKAHEELDTAHALVVHLALYGGLKNSENIDINKLSTMALDRLVKIDSLTAASMVSKEEADQLIPVSSA